MLWTPRPAGWRPALCCGASRPMQRGCAVVPAQPCPACKPIHLCLSEASSRCQLRLLSSQGASCEPCCCPTDAAPCAQAAQLRSMASVSPSARSPPQSIPSPRGGGPFARASTTPAPPEAGWDADSSGGGSRSSGSSSSSASSSPACGEHEMEVRWLQASPVQDAGLCGTQVLQQRTEVQPLSACPPLAARAAACGGLAQHQPCQQQGWLQLPKRVRLSSQHAHSQPECAFLQQHQAGTAAGRRVPPQGRLMSGILDAPAGVHASRTQSDTASAVPGAVEAAAGTADLQTGTAAGMRLAGSRPAAVLPQCPRSWPGRADVSQSAS